MRHGVSENAARVPPESVLTQKESEMNSGGNVASAALASPQGGSRAAAPPAERTDAEIVADIIAERFNDTREKAAKLIARFLTPEERAELHPNYTGHRFWEIVDIGIERAKRGERVDESRASATIMASIEIAAEAAVETEAA